MAKINDFLLEYKEAISVLPSEISSDPPVFVIKRFVQLFANIDDSRCAGMIEYPLEEILLVVFLAVLANSATWREIEAFGKCKIEWLRKFLPFKNGTPSHDTFRRVFSLIDSKQVEEATVTFLMDNIGAIKASLGIVPKDGDVRLICVDGKEQRGTGRKYGTSEAVRNLQTLHVFDASQYVCLASRDIDCKTNEIPVAQEILKTMDLTGCVVTFDALHTQRETVKVIREQSGDYVGGLKENQPSLLDDARTVFSAEECARIKRSGDYYCEQKEKAHNHSETRKYFMAPAAFGAALEEDWKGLRSFVLLEKTTEDLVTHEKTYEKRYYITSLTDLALAEEAIRGHWGIENKLHWQLDYTFLEDDNTTMDSKAFQNLSIINKLCLSLCNLAKPLVGKSASIRLVRKVYSWDLENQLSKLLNAFDEDAIHEALITATQKKPRKKKAK